MYPTKNSDLEGYFYYLTSCQSTAIYTRKWIILKISFCIFYDHNSIFTEPKQHSSTKVKQKTSVAKTKTSETVSIH